MSVPDPAGAAKDIAPDLVSPVVKTGVPSLDAFFASALPYARGYISPEQLVERLGPSASGVKRLALYPDIVKTDNRHLLNKMYLAAQKATDRYRLGLWTRWLDEFQPLHPARDWRVRLYGQALFAFVKEKREKNPHQPAYLEELVDLAWVRSEAMCGPPENGDDVIDKTVFVRHYTHAVPAYFIAVQDDPDAPPPEAKPTFTIIYRSLHTMRPRFFHPNVPALLALARRTNTAAELLAQFTMVTEEMIQAGEDALIEHGILASRS